MFEAQMKRKWKTKLENVKSFHWIVNVGVIIRTSFEHSFPYPCGILNVYWICTTDMTHRNPNTKTSIYTISTITVLLSESATFEACRALLPSSLHASSNVPMLMYFEFPISRSRLNFKRLGTFLPNLFRKQTLTKIVSSVFRTRL